ncbi:hypothetical protein ABNavy97_194 [Acinetobacter phage AB-Navy97]|uniref:Uncharacterized protein n=2 Tax=Hadassahvirus TaxID=2842716 RepID=A0A6B9SVW0_9CAUD|nr:hypothetical protein HYP74_gp157 [Acinetobacter phage AbTZA1]YP_009887162.1 hypothetical protein HYQ24_gp142 [Acinetobacter phage vB_AbaM_PhT2]UNI74869.1 hypothetical protein ABNavy97_194 [Acinetobacter phage AB-Navy97]UQS94267.1 hypothetical protein ABNavy71_198 [Acinetobacter phage AB-Navy71]AZU98695.1 hypothetical protein [Acinetobacter phage AbTZA1]QHJ75754.1 hypothetical protein vBAbaMPhT2_142 [Acinetobacter phage vB_AbaM_PhT2]
MAKVSSFRPEQVTLTCDEPTVRNLSERWVVQFIGAPGLEFATMGDNVTLTNVHYVCPYRKFSWGWGIDPWKTRLLVKDFDFERGIVTVDGVTKELEFYVDEKEYK